LPMTLMLNPPSLALIALCSDTLAYSTRHICFATRD
jgi:hypothetical protein